MQPGGTLLQQRQVLLDLAAVEFRQVIAQPVDQDLDGAQRRLQVVGRDVGELLEIAVGPLQFQRFLLQPPFGLTPLGNVDRERQDADDLSGRPGGGSVGNGVVALRAVAHGARFLVGHDLAGEAAFVERFALLPRFRVDAFRDVPVEVAVAGITVPVVILAAEEAQHAIAVEVGEQARHVVGEMLHAGLGGEEFLFQFPALAYVDADAEDDR